MTCLSRSLPGAESPFNWGLGRRAVDGSRSQPSPCRRRARPRTRDPQIDLLLGRTISSHQWGSDVEITRWCWKVEIEVLFVNHMSLPAPVFVARDCALLSSSQMAAGGRSLPERPTSREEEYMAAGDFWGRGGNTTGLALENRKPCIGPRLSSVIDDRPDFPDHVLQSDCYLATPHRPKLIWVMSG